MVDVSLGAAIWRTGSCPCSTSLLSTSLMDPKELHTRAPTYIYSPSCQTSHTCNCRNCRSVCLTCLHTPTAANMFHLLFDTSTTINMQTTPVARHSMTSDTNMFYPLSDSMTSDTNMFYPLSDSMTPIYIPKVLCWPIE